MYANKVIRAYAILTRMYKRVLTHIWRLLFCLHICNFMIIPHVFCRYLTKNIKSQVASHLRPYSVYMHTYPYIYIYCIHSYGCIVMNMHMYLCMFTYAYVCLYNTGTRLTEMYWYLILVNINGKINAIYNFYI